MSDITDKIEKSEASPAKGAVATPPKETSKKPMLKRTAGGQKKKPVKKAAPKAAPKPTVPKVMPVQDAPPSLVMARNYPATPPDQDEKSVPPQGGRPDRSKPVRVKFSDRNRVSFNNMSPDYMYRLVNDKDGRIEKLQKIGYELVQDDEHIGDFRVAEASKLGSAVSKPVGNGVTGYLMKIRKEFYDEDRKAKDEVVDRTERAMKPDKSKNETGPGLTYE